MVVMKYSHPLPPPQQVEGTTTGFHKGINDPLTYTVRENLFKLLFHYCAWLLLTKTFTLAQEQQD